MIKCKICGKEFKYLHNHVINAHKMKPEEYYLAYINSVKGICKTCGQDTKFVNIKEGYREYCCSGCVSKNTYIKHKREITTIKNYGCKNPSQSDVVKKRKENTCLKNYGVKVPYKSEEIRNRGKSTCLKNHGVEYPTQSEEIRNKGKLTCLKNNGVDHPCKSDKIMDIVRETNMRNRGCEYPSQSEEVKDKRKKTWLKNLGCDHPMFNKEIAKKTGDANRLNFKRVLIKYPELVLIEDLKEGPNGEILGHCKNSNCPNSVENGSRFILTVGQIWYRNQGINSTSDSNYLYCCEECKHECILFNNSANQLENLLNPQIDDLSKASPAELSFWRSEVFSRQLKVNQEHNSNYCEICHKIENLVGHHILPQKLYPESALDPDNGVILCSECHNKYGHTKGTECSTGNLANKICK
jgi:hypothetical protein